MGNELRVIEDCRDLFIKVFDMLKDFDEFKYTLNPQIIRASVSVGSNVVEGQRRGKKEFKRFLDIAIGSCDEVKYQLSLYITQYHKDHIEEIKEINEKIKLCDKIIEQLVNLKKSLNS